MYCFLFFYQWNKMSPLKYFYHHPSYESCLRTYAMLTSQQETPSERSERGYMELGYMLGYIESGVLK
jgi:hypothetical protein